MKNCSGKALDLADARKRIAAKVRPGKSESVDLLDALGRVPVTQLAAKNSLPGYDQSTRDGYVIPSKSEKKEGKGCWYTIGGEIPAGSIGEILLSDGVCYRIMTGGLVPDKGVRVIPQEDCCQKEGRIFVEDVTLKRRSTFIRAHGCDIKEKELVVPSGKALTVDDLVTLAETGHTHISVYERPRISYFCSGNELVAEPSEVRKGLKVSANCFLLDGLIRRYGGLPKDLGIVADSMDAVIHVLDSIDPANNGVVVSTGGMGPGRYDVIEEAFRQRGGEIIYSSLNLRPGKKTLFGVIGKTLYFGLPGPPPAVRTLFYELVKPVLLIMQGVEEWQPRPVKAYLQTPISLKKYGILNLRAGIIYTDGGRLCVRACNKGEHPSAYILIKAERKQVEAGEIVDVHLVTRETCLL